MMNELSRHIESLLLTHDCVTIPHFGAFVTKYVPAVHSQEEDVYYPPMRSVRFNADMKEDDGLLTSSVCNAYGCTSSEARARVQNLVMNLRQQLLADGQADFGILGQFEQDEDGHITFEACQAGAVTPLFYGLDSFVFPRLSTASRAKASHQSARAAIEAADEMARNSAFAIRQTPNGITIHIGHSLIRATSLVAAILLLFFLLPTHNISNPLQSGGVASVIPIPAEKSSKATSVTVAKTTDYENVAQIGEETATEKATAETTDITAEGNSADSKAEDMPAEPAAAITKATAGSAETAETAASKPHINNNVSETPETKTAYCIVVASAISKANAERYAKELQERGMKSARVMIKGKMVRVVLDGFDTEEETVESLRKMRHNNEEFANAWVLHL
ncbi:MAG: SPOR domain-containing protein [Bacteroidaceae bacterium]|nr:SPOR domain-containing protein [Bacteroidaceae bacterium]